MRYESQRFRFNSAFDVELGVGIRASSQPTVLNPVRAKMVDHPSEYPWSSYQTNARGEVNQSITPHRLYLRLAKTAQARQKAYRALFKSRLPDQILNDIRESTNKAWVLGSNRFKQQIEKKLNRRAVSLPKGGDRRSEKYREA